MHEFDRILGFVCHLCSTGDEVDQTIQNIPPMGRKRGIEVGER